MAERNSSRKLTRSDVLVVTTVCLLLIFLVPVLFARPREVSIRRLCAANLAQIGKAMFIYADDNEGALPRAGGPGTVWNQLPPSGWCAATRAAAYGLTTQGSGGTASISSCFYLLVRYLQVPTRVFVCGGDRGTTEFKLVSIVPPGPIDLGDFWDFGPPIDAFRHCSYAYHIPYSGGYALSTASDPNLAVAADRNPWIASPAARPGVWQNFRPDIIGEGGVRMGTSAMARKGNSISHQLDGQNVLFVDGRVTFERRAYCGVDMDNIYTLSRDIIRGDLYGVVPWIGPSCIPMNRKDSVLVHDPDAFPPYTPPKRN